MLHRGRIQAQGGGLEESVSWTQDKPLTLFEAIDFIKLLKKRIGISETQKRSDAFRKAEQFIREASKNGGLSACIKRTFKVKGTKDVRVDIEVLSGIAFV